MRRSPWIAGVLVAAAAAGCGGMYDARKDETALGQLPMSDKQQVFTSQHNVEVAEANRAATERSVEQAKTFADVSNKELEASKTRLEAARKAMILGRETRTGENQSEANISLVERELAAQKAKKDFADSLVALRERENDLAGKRLDEARVELSYTRAFALSRNGIKPHEDMNALLRQRESKLADIAAADQRIAAQRGQTEQLRVAWQDRRRSFNVAARETTTPIIPPPGPPSQIAPQPLPPPAAPAPVMQRRANRLELTPGGTMAPSPHGTNARLTPGGSPVEACEPGTTPGVAK